MNRLLLVLSLAYLALCLAGKLAAQDAGVAPPPATCYSNGPINGTLWAWPMTPAIDVTNEFNSGTCGTINFFRIGVWIPNCTPLTSCIPTAVDVLIGSAPFGFDLAYYPAAPVTAVVVNASPSTVSATSNPGLCFPAGCTLYNLTVNITPGPFLGGNSWLTLLNPVNPKGSPVLWDMNCGASQAYINLAFALPCSESFDAY